MKSTHQEKPTSELGISFHDPAKCKEDKKCLPPGQLLARLARMTSLPDYVIQAGGRTGMTVRTGTSFISHLMKWQASRERSSVQ